MDECGQKIKKKRKKLSNIHKNMATRLFILFWYIMAKKKITI